MLRRLALAFHRFVLRTSSSPLRSVWWLLHELALRLLGWLLRLGIPGATAYASGSFGSGEPVYGLSDLDLVIVVPDDPRGPGRTRARVLERWRRLCRLAPPLTIVFQIAVHEDAGLRAAASATTLTFGLDQGRGSEPSLYGDYSPLPRFGAGGLLHGPGLYGPTRGWRRLVGPDRLPPVRPYDDQDRRISAWLTLQSWWRWLFGACLGERGPRTAYLCVKLVSEPIRVLLWLDRAEQFYRPTDTLRRALRVMPQHEEPIKRALELKHLLVYSPAAPLGEMLGWFVELSSEIARRIAFEAMSAGVTSVRLGWGDQQELVIPATRQAPDGDPRWSRLLPLTDWRALSSPSSPDEAFEDAGGDPRDPAQIGAAARREDGSRYAALRSDELLVLPTEDLWERGRMRSVQCRATDPVSFALLKGDRQAVFPDVKGWSAEHLARRAVAENRTWLDRRAPAANPTIGECLARGICAARAALFMESIDAGHPELPLTAAATARSLVEHDLDPEGAVAEAFDGYRRWRVDGEDPPAAATAALYRVVRSLPAYEAPRDTPPTRA